MPGKTWWSSNGSPAPFRPQRKHLCSSMLFPPAVLRCVWAGGKVGDIPDVGHLFQRTVKVTVNDFTLLGYYTAPGVRVRPELDQRRITGVHLSGFQLHPDDFRAAGSTPRHNCHQPCMRPALRSAAVPLRCSSHSQWN